MPSLPMSDKMLAMTAIVLAVLALGVAAYSLHTASCAKTHALRVDKRFISLMAGVQAAAKEDAEQEALSQQEAREQAGANL